MSFLDNCGSIVLDAILTDVGRKRMAQGTFKVSKFALGDDEVDYSLYDATASNNADPHDADRAILSQSCFEAFSNDSAVINYGLTNFVSNHVFYMPEMKLNYSGSQTTGQPEEREGFTRPYEGVFYLSANDETSLKLKEDLSSDNYFLKSGNSLSNKIVIESGINSDEAEASATESNRKDLILDNGLLDSYMIVYVDSRLFISVMSQPRGSKFETRANGAFLYNLGPLQGNTPVTLPRIIDSHDSYLISAADNKVMHNTTTNDLHFSAIKGTRGAVAAIGLTMENRLCGTSTTNSDPKYAEFGKTSEVLFSGANKYDYIDTTVYAIGASSNAQISIPVRIVRYAGT